MSKFLWIQCWIWIVKKSWLKHGGYQTLASFGASSAEYIPKKYIEFILDLPYYYEADGYLFVHGGLDFEEENPLNDNLGLMWERHWYDKINYDWLEGRKVVHGHTPIPKVGIELLLTHFNDKQYINLDSGCFKINENKGMGYLTAFETTEQKLHFKECVDEVTFVLV